jgi:hypothetical protein
MKSNHEELNVSLGCTCCWASNGRAALLLAHRALNDTTKSKIVRALFRPCMLAICDEQAS